LLRIVGKARDFFSLKKKHKQLEQVAEELHLALLANGD